MQAVHKKQAQSLVVCDSDHLITSAHLHQFANTIANQRRCLIIAHVRQNLNEVVMRSLAYGR